MPTPVGPDAHLDVPLSNLAVSAFSDGTNEFIADQLFPNVDVGKQSDKYYVIEKGEFLKVPDALRAPKTKARKVEYQVSSDSYFAHNYALANENALEDLANADNAIRLRENSTRIVTVQLRRAQEVRIADIVTTAANLGSGTTLSGSNQWDDFVGSDPIADVTTGAAYIRGQTGLIPNFMVMDWDTAKIVRRHPLLLDMYKYTQGGMIGMTELQSAFDVDRILVGRAIKENALEGGTSSITNVWGNNVLLAHIEPGVSLQTQTLGLRFGWRPAGFPGAFGVERNVESGAGTRKVEVVEAGHFQDERIVATELGYLIASSISG